MSFMNNPNWARDMLWSSTLRSIRDATSLEDEEKQWVLLGTDHIVIRVMQDVMLIIELPAGASQWTEDEFQEYVDGLMFVGRRMYEDSLEQ